MTLAHPLWLLAAAPALALAALELRRRWSATRSRRALALAVRVIVLAALATAAAEPRWTGRRRDSTVVFLIDRSASIDDAALAASWTRATELRGTVGDSRAAVIVFDAVPELALGPGDTWTPMLARGANTSATDVAAAIRLGLGMIPPGAGGHLVLLGDGRANSGDVRGATADAMSRGIPISVVPSDVVRDDPAIASVVLDSDRVRSGASLTGHVDLDAGGVVGRGRVTVTIGGTEVVAKDVVLDGKHAQVPFTYSLPPSQKPGVVPVEAKLVPAGVDRDPTNDRGSSDVVVERPPHVTIIDGDDGGADRLADVLRAEQMKVTVISGTGEDVPDLANTDLVILANAPARAGSSAMVLDDELGERLVRWVNDGGGLIVTGGPSALDGNYAANRIADALPVEIEPMTPAIDSATTVIVVLDQSGSMGVTVGARTKLALAAEGASAAIRLLRSFDRVAVAAVQDSVSWVVPMQMIGGKTGELEAKLRNLRVGGGGINVYTGLKAAQDEMNRAKTPIKHVILFADTFDAAEQIQGDYSGEMRWDNNRPNSLTLAKQLRAKGVTLSVIGIGEGRDGAFNPATYIDDEDDSDFLRQLAADGGGRYYRTTDANQLRGLFIQDARRLLNSSAREGAIKVNVLAAHAALDGVDLAKAPALKGYVEVKPRPAAQVIVAEDKTGSPIFSRWPYGLGEVTVWTSDAGARWATDWAEWPGYARFWTQLVRSALRRHEGDATAIETERAEGTATVRVVRRDERASSTIPEARIVQGDNTRPLPLRVIEPGTYEATVDIAADPVPTVELVEGGKVIAHRTIVRAPSDELRQRGPDLGALGRLATSTGGKVSPASINAVGRDTPSSTSLTAWFLLFGILLVPIDAGLRRAARDP